MTRAATVYAFDSALLLEKLYGQAFAAPNRGTGRSESLQIRPKSVFSARRGLEAYGVRVLHRHAHGDVHAFMKIFKRDVPERRERSAFLMDQGLARLHDWAFQGVPYGWFDRSSINGIEVVGHLTKFIGMQYDEPAEDFEVLKGDGDWTHSIDQRLGFVAHLAAAVEALERMRIVHGDLSHGNVMIGPGPRGRLICCLCDFDGFRHPNVPLLPRRFEDDDVRPLGTEGYQYPELLARIAADRKRVDAALHVETDRFALAALACEMMVWSPKLAERLGARTTLLSDEIIAQRRLDRLPEEARALFPKGFDLLRRALEAGSCEDMPAPADWLDLCEAPAPEPSSFGAAPFVQLIDRRSPPRLIGKTLLNGARSGDLRMLLSRDLPSIIYSVDREARSLTLNVTGGFKTDLRRGGRIQSLDRTRRRALTIQPGDALLIADWEISFEIGTPTAFKKADEEG